MGVILLCPARPDEAVLRESSESWASLSTFLTQGLCSEMATQASARPSPITFWPLRSTRSLSEETAARSRGRALQPRRVPHGIEGCSLSSVPRAVGTPGRTPSPRDLGGLPRGRATPHRGPFPIRSAGRASEGMVGSTVCSPRPETRVLFRPVASPLSDVSPSELLRG